MIKYVPEETSVVFLEVPDEVTLALNISNCQHRCPGCHSPHLATDIGIELTHDELSRVINKNHGITCVAFMGEGNDHDALIDCAKFVKSNFPNLKICIYSGSVTAHNDFWHLFDYVKIGPYVEEYGPLNAETTNQRMYCINGDEYKDITNKFWRKQI